jgi:hypothetical protein
MSACNTRRISIPRPDPDVVSTALPGGDTVLLHLRTSQYFSLNATGSLLWQLMESATDPEGMSQALSDRFEVTPGTAHESVLELLRDMKAHQLICGMDREESTGHE